MDSVGDLVQELVERDAFLADGTVVADDYRIERRVGRGGMGMVYLARDLRLDRWVAIKIHRQTSADAVDRLAREATALARLQHPNVVAIHRIGTHEGRLFVAMEYVDGGTLRDWLHASRRSWREIIAMFTGAGHGLAAAHRAGLVHRDFKPDNVLVGSDGRARIADFGLARAISAAPVMQSPPRKSEQAPTMGEDGTPSTPIDSITVTAPLPPSTPGPDVTVTVTGALIGTPGYMAPEQKDGAVDARADQYALSVSIWEALFGQRPGAPPVAPDRAVPRRIVAALRRGLSVDPAARFPDVEALLAAMRPSWRRRAAIAAAAAALVALAAAVMLWPMPRRLRPLERRAGPVAIAFEIGGAGRQIAEVALARDDGDLILAGSSSQPFELRGRHVAPRDRSASRFGWVARLDAAGRVRWVTVLDTSGDARTTCAALLPDGDVALAGAYTGEARALPVATVEGVDQRGGYVARLDGDTGTIAWSQSVVGSGWAHMNAITSTPDGRIVATGYQSGDVSIAGRSLTSAPGTQTGLVIAFDGSGQVDWIRRVESASTLRIHSIAAGPGAIYAAVGVPAGRGNADAVVERLDPATGALVWRSVIGGAGADMFTGIAVAPDGRVVASGYFRGSLTAAGRTLTSAGGEDALVAAFDAADGAIVWIHTHGGRAFDDLRGLAIAADGTIWAIGRSYGSSSVGTLAPAALGGADVMVMRFDRDGHVLDATRMGGDLDDYPKSIRIGRDGRPLVSGKAGSATAHFGSHTLHFDIDDAFVLELATETR